MNDYRLIPEQARQEIQAASETVELPIYVISTDEEYCAGYPSGRYDGTGTKQRFTLSFGDDPGITFNTLDDLLIHLQSFVKCERISQLQREIASRRRSLEAADGPAYYRARDGREGQELRRLENELAQLKPKPKPEPAPQPARRPHPKSVQADSVEHACDLLEGFFGRNK